MRRGGENFDSRFEAQFGTPQNDVCRSVSVGAGENAGQGRDEAHALQPAGIDVFVAVLRAKPAARSRAGGGF